MPSRHKISHLKSNNNIKRGLLNGHKRYHLSPVYFMPKEKESYNEITIKQGRDFAENVERKCCEISYRIMQKIQLNVILYIIQHKYFD